MNWKTAAYGAAAIAGSDLALRAPVLGSPIVNRLGGATAGAYAAGYLVGAISVGRAAVLGILSVLAADFVGPMIPIGNGFPTIKRFALGAGAAVAIHAVGVDTKVAAAA